MKKILIVLLEKYVDWEAAYVSAGISQLAESKYCVKTVSITNKLIHSTGGLLVHPDYDLSTIPDDYVAAILVGGYTWRNEETLALKPFIQKCVDEGKLLAAICDATIFIGKMGLLNSINHTSNDLQDLADYVKTSYTGQRYYLHRQCVRDGNIITANGTATGEFAREILRYIDVTDPDELNEWFAFYKNGLYSTNNMHY